MFVLNKPNAKTRIMIFMFYRPGAENWQDHWCPSYFPVVGNVQVEAGDTVRLKVTHSELNIMFEVLGVDANVERQRQDVDILATSEAGNNAGAG